MIIGPAYFADSSFWIALIQTSDLHHARAHLWRRHIVSTAALTVTTEAVLWETLNYFAAPVYRPRALQLYHTCHTHRQFRVEPHDPAHDAAAIALYQSRPDKAWGITDCLSFQTMHRHNLTLVLTADHHFTQANFDALLLRDPAA